MAKKDAPKSGCMTKALPLLGILFVIAAVMSQCQKETPPAPTARPYITPPPQAASKPTPIDRVTTDPAKVATPSGSLPKYSIIRSVELLDGGRAGYVLTPTLSQKTPVAERKRVLSEVMKVYGFTQAVIYQNEGAYKWDRNSDYQELHKDAWKGIVMEYLDGKFYLPEESHGP